MIRNNSWYHYVIVVERQTKATTPQSSLSSVELCTSVPIPSVTTSRKIKNISSFYVHVHPLTHPSESISVFLPHVFTFFNPLSPSLPPSHFPDFSLPLSLSSYCDQWSPNLYPVHPLPQLLFFHLVGLNDHMSDEQFAEWLTTMGMSQHGDRQKIIG